MFEHGTFKVVRNMLLAFGVTCAAAAFASSSDPFAGAWEVTATPDQATAGDGVSAFGEEVLFHNGQFTAAALAMLGFEATSYHVETSDGVTEFDATLVSSTRGTVEWSGRRTLTGFSGTLLWTKVDGDVHRYTLSARRPWEDAVVSDED
jgi:hypothetical protein